MKKIYIVPSIDIEFADLDAEFMFGPQSAKTRITTGVAGEEPTITIPGVEKTQGTPGSLGAKGNHFFSDEEEEW